MSLAIPRRGFRAAASAGTTTYARRVSLLVWMITAAAFVLRLSQMRQSLYGDELWTYQQIAGHTLGQTLRAIRGGAATVEQL